VITAEMPEPVPVPDREPVLAGLGELGAGLAPLLTTSAEVLHPVGKPAGRTGVRLVHRHLGGLLDG
jgi:hypothetical protein